MNAEPAKPIFVDAPPSSKPLVITRVVPRAAATVSPPSTIDSPPRPIGRMAPKAVSMDDALIAILDRPLGSGETVAAGYARKESELAGAFTRLPVADARALHARLTINAANDALAVRFARLTVDRRTRLLVFLADARRREAMRAR